MSLPHHPDVTPCPKRPGLFCGCDKSQPCPKISKGKEFDTMRECEEFAEVMRKLNTVSHTGFACVDLSE